MKVVYLLLLGIGLSAPAAHAQTATTPATAPANPLRYTTGTGQATFFSTAPLEDIEALNSKVGAVFELATGQLAFSMLMRDFQFKNTLMQEHFNENYAESEKHPRARFSGKLLAVPTEAALMSGPQAVTVEGLLTIHGTTRKVRVPGTLQLRDNNLVVTSKFSVAPADYRIKIPALVRDNIAKTIDVSVIMTCPPTAEATASR
jgi:hypothetical protein